jgi:hypothetical protein
MVHVQRVHQACQHVADAVALVVTYAITVFVSLMVNVSMVFVFPEKRVIRKSGGEFAGDVAQVVEEGLFPINSS